MSRFLHSALKGVLKPSELSSLISGFDIIGDIALLRIPDALLDSKYLIARAVLDGIKPIKTVLKAGGVTGEFRTRDVEFLMGEEKTRTMYVEHGCRFIVDVNLVYFSPRLSTERLRIANEVSPGEVIVNMFAGIGSFSIITSKIQRDCRVFNIDINPAAHSLALENVKLNHLENRVIPLLGDAKEVIREKLVGTADRILMVLPEKSHLYLKDALIALRPTGGVIHCYTFLPLGANPGDFIEANMPKESNFSVTVNKSIRVGEVGPKLYRYRIDLVVR